MVFRSIRVGPGNWRRFRALRRAAREVHRHLNGERARAVTMDRLVGGLVDRECFRLQHVCEERRLDWEEIWGRAWRSTDPHAADDEPTGAEMPPREPDNNTGR